MKIVHKIDAAGLYLEDEIIYPDSKKSPDLPDKYTLKPDQIDIQPVGFHTPKWNGLKWIEAADISILAAQAKNIQRLAINEACAAQIVGGFVSSALGAAHTYDSSLEHQLNLIAAKDSPVSIDYTCTDSAGVKAAILHTPAQLKKVFVDGTVFKLAALAKARLLKKSLDAIDLTLAGAITKIKTIKW